MDDQEPQSTVMRSSENREQDVQTDEWTQEKSVNTNDNWEQLMRGLIEQSGELVEECQSLEKQQNDDELKHKSQIQSLEKLRDEKKRQLQALIDKIMSVQLKLNLNSSKTARKSFNTKVEELISEKAQKLEAKKRLTNELEDIDGKLKKLTEEQRNEKLLWEQEIMSLQQEMEKLSRQVEESSQAALNDERAALESQRELAVSQVEEWIAEAERYLSVLRSDPSPQSFQLRIEWEKNVGMTRTRLGKLKLSYNENLKQLLQGKELDSLPKILPPLLPHIPMIDLLNFTPVIHPPATQLPYHPTRRHASAPPSIHSPAVFAPPTLEQHMPVPTPDLPTSARSTPRSYTHSHSAPSAALANIASSFAHGTVPVASLRNPAPQALPSNPQPTGKLDKLLEKLGTQFPQCTRTQLMGVLQQVKSERGTMAGMSVEDIKQQVELKLMQSERPPLGPIAPPAGSRHSHKAPVQPALSPLPPVHVPSAHIFQPRSSQAVPSVRKLCLMCQNHVEPGTQYSTNCPHTLHRECISVWLKSSKNNSCPFCPSK